MRATKWIATAATAAGLAFSTGAGAVPVGLELMLLFDNSGSIDDTEYQLQKTGYVQAFQSASVQNAILANLTGSIAVTYVEWSGSAEQSVRVGWTLVDSAAAANAFAAAINATTCVFAGLTAVQSAMNAVHLLFRTETGASANGFESPRQVIDVPGDGADNDSPGALLPSGGRDNALATGVDAVNGIAILRGGAGSRPTTRPISSAVRARSTPRRRPSPTSPPPSSASWNARSGVPEPATLGLLAAGLVGAGIGRRRC